MLEVYRQLAALRRELPELTDPAFARNRCVVDEDTRLFTLYRGDVVIVVNFGRDEVTTDVADGLELRFETESGVDLDGAMLTVPGHAGALLAPTRTR
jgi:maltooligosyltrehalose trehalohydrolase